MSDSDSTASDQEEVRHLENIRNELVENKYMEAARISRLALELVFGLVVPGAAIFDICRQSDKLIIEETGKLYRKDKKMTKGIGFPTSLTRSEVTGAYSPLGATDSGVIQGGDVLKIDLGVQIDGYLAQVAHTIVVPTTTTASGDEEKLVVEDKRADVVAAAYTAADAVLRLMRPGAKNTDLTEIVNLVAADYGVKAVDGVFSHCNERFEIEGEKKFDNGVPEVPRTGDDRTKEATVEAYEVWHVDILMSTGQGSLTPFGERTTVFRRADDSHYKPKIKASRAMLQRIIDQYPNFPFAVANLVGDDENANRIHLGTKELLEHRVIDPYPVVREKDGEFVANVKFTVLIFPTKTVRATSLVPDGVQAPYKSTKTITNEKVIAALATPVLGKKKKKRKKKKAKKKAPAAAE